MRSPALVNDSIIFGSADKAFCAFATTLVLLLNEAATRQKKTAIPQPLSAPYL
ncbi:MAG: hypothetical protein OFPII_35950 [Osedax symbiont Rs1]|nr:MAG: hypothetical protein OFPII_35950 [Osedax symbiont Rs1]